MEHISIDIHIPKLLDWLVSRKICKTNWQNGILNIREKINSAIQDMPEHQEITTLLSGTYINYFHCCRIVEILRETEADTQNFFGQYGSKRMKDWLEIVKLYKKDNIYLAEAANLLFRTVKYEIPSMKKQLVKATQIQEECEKKIADYDKSVNQGNNELRKISEQLNVRTGSARRDLIKRTKDLDNIYSRVAEDVRLLEEASKYYTDFTKYTSDTNIALSLINFVIERGNTTTYEWLYGECPHHIELPSSLEIEEEQQEDVDGINWEIEDIATQQHHEADDIINWDIGNDNIEVVSGNLEENFDVEIAVKEDNCGISVVNESGIVVEDSGSAASVAKGNNALTVLDNPKTREEFITELLELESFLKMRLLEMQSRSDNVLINLNEFQVPSEKVLTMLDGVNIVKGLMTDPITEQLHFIKHSPRYTDKLIASIEQKIANIEKMKTSKEATELRYEEAVQAEANLRPKIKLIMQKTRELQKQITSDISDRYNNRPVHLIGGY